MADGFRRPWLIGAVAVLGAGLLASAPEVARAQDFFSALFGGFGGGREAAAPPMRMPFAGDDTARDMPQRPATPRARVSYGSSQAWCVRTCDGRYFPVTGTSEQSRAAACNSFCPASETRVVYGSNIDNAATDNGKPYSALENAFRYRNELVAGCTCNGRDQIGLAPVKIEDDPTLRKGDIVAGEEGLKVANQNAGRSGAKHAELNFSPASPALQARFQRVPVVAAE